MVERSERVTEILRLLGTDGAHGVTIGYQRLSAADVVYYARFAAITVPITETDHRELFAEGAHPDAS